MNRTHACMYGDWWCALVWHHNFSKVSKMFGKLFKPKTTKVPENILTEDFLQDLGLKPVHQRMGSINL